MLILTVFFFYKYIYNVMCNWNFINNLEEFIIIHIY